MIVGNWKMNLNIKQSVNLAERLSMHIGSARSKVVICPNFTALNSVSEKLGNNPKISIGAQNINDNDEGAYTGEISGPMLKGLASYVIIGHSERRINYGETDEIIAKKVAAAIRNNIKPILCVGENIHERQEGMAARTVTDQLEEDLSEIIPAEAKKVTIAYEPVWAIGTGMNADPYDVEKMALEIYRFLVNKYGNEMASKIKILYGGSVNSDNAKAYLDVNNVNGLLVGGASLNYKTFSKICQL
jgi:triosephosphate isomerase